MKPIDLPLSIRDFSNLLPDGDTLVVGEVVDERHPALVGRVRVRLDRRDGGEARWLPVLRAVSVRTGDRVVTGTVQGCVEPVVLGVLDGFADRRPCPPEFVGIELRPHEVVRVHMADGTPLFDLAVGDRGPEIHMHGPRTCVRAAECLRLEAPTVEIVATRGNAEVTAAADVVVNGETIQLN